MIILQLLTFLLLVPFSILMLILFNVYSINWICVAVIGVITFVYALLWGFVFYSWNFAIILFLALSVFYWFRLKKLRETVKKTLVLRGKIKNKFHFDAQFMFPLSFLNLFNKLPDVIKKELTKVNKLEMDLPTLIELIIVASMGTKIEIVNNEVEINIEIIGVQNE